MKILLEALEIVDLYRVRSPGFSVARPSPSPLCGLMQDGALDTSKARVALIKMK
jgi:hypothetical protein